MKKILGIFGLLLFICVATALMSDRFLTEFNIENLIRRSALFGILSIGAAFVIITAGIDLSIGSVVCLIGCLTPWMLVHHELPVPLMLLIIASISLLIGLTHGLLITKVKLQPFVVTLCGLLFYRGLTRGIVQDQTQGFKSGFKELRELSQGQLDLPGSDFGIPNPCLILIAVTILGIIFLNFTVYGRYMLALGRNETAARFSGINTDRMIILAYVICGMLSGLGGLLFVLDVGSTNRSTLATSTNSMRLPVLCWVAAAYAVVKEPSWGWSLVRPSCKCSKTRSRWSTPFQPISSTP